MDADFDLYRLTDEHEAVRDAVRAVCTDKVAPHAADVDATGTFPQASYDALRAAEFHAPHIPETYGGAGADALATCLVIEEVARACASTSLIPAVNKLGTMPLLLAASDEVKARYLPPVAAGEALFSYGLSEREAGSDTASMKTRAVPVGDGWVLSGQKSWITNAGVSEYYTVMAVTDPEAGSRGITAFVVEASDEGFSLGRPSASSASGARPRANCSSTGARYRATGSSANRVMACRSLYRRWTTPGSPSVRRRSGSPPAPWTSPRPTSRNAGSSAGPWRSSRECSSCSPTWP